MLNNLISPLNCEERGVSCVFHPVFRNFVKNSGGVEVLCVV